MLAVPTPEPICIAGVLLLPEVPLLEMRNVSLNESANSTRPALNPVVLTLAMLLPMTSISCWKFCRPLIPEFRERSIVVFVSCL